MRNWIFAISAIFVSILLRKKTRGRGSAQTVSEHTQGYHCGPKGQVLESRKKGRYQRNF